LQLLGRLRLGKSSRLGSAGEVPLGDQLTPA
jgi:hypothetical protein